MTSPASFSPSRNQRPDCRESRLRVIFWMIALLLGALHAWAARNSMGPDGISYLDLADAWWRGDWKSAVNAHWGPLYSWILGLALHLIKPTPYWEFAVAHLVNFILYIFALCCFEIFMTELIRHHEHARSVSSSDASVTLPAWAWRALGYTLFIWSSLHLANLSYVGPDILVAGYVYLLAASLLRIRKGNTGWPVFACLGAVLGISYLTKAVMFILGFVFLGTAFFCVGNLRKAVSRVGLAAVVFLTIAGPYIVTLSRAKGRWTFSDSGRLVYYQYVNREWELAHWQGDKQGSIPAHPTRKVADNPATYEFAAPIGGCYPPWYDISYWCEGVRPRFQLRNQLKTLWESVTRYYDYALSPTVGFLVGLLALWWVGANKFRLVRDTVSWWPLFLPAVTALALYALVDVEERYIAAYVVLIWMGLFSGIRLTDSPDNRRLLAGLISAMAITMMLVVGGLCALKLPSNFKKSAVHESWYVANGLNNRRVLPGMKVALIGNPLRQYWPRLAGVKVIADVPMDDVSSFWEINVADRTRTLSILARQGAKAVVVPSAPEGSALDGWERIGDTPYWMHWLTYQ